MSPLDRQNRELLLDTYMDALYPALVVFPAATTRHPVLSRVAFRLTRNGPMAFINSANN